MATPNLTAINLSDKQGGEKFQMTPDEMKAIQKKMDDPEFMRLWAEYAQSLSDPKVREEEEAYLRQVEEEARSQGDYTMEFIFPRPVYAVELTNAPDAKRNHRVAINICESDKVEQFREETTGNRRAANWFVPITVGAMRVETDPADSYKGQWEVYDAVFNPLTVSLANRDAKFMCFLTEIAVENINDGYKRRLGFEFQRLSSDVPSLGVPKNQTVRKAVPGSETAKRQAAAPVEVSLGPIKATLDSAARPAATPPPAKPAAASSAAPKPAPPTAGPKNKGVTFSVAHRGEIDLTDAWNWGKSDKRIGVPKELVVRATVPTVARAAELDVEVDGTAVDVQTEDGSVKGTAVLPFAVLPDPVSAKFDKSRRELTLVLAVVPPAAPADSAMSPSVDRRGDASSAASPEPKVPAGEEAREAAVAAEAARAAKIAQEAASAAEEAHRRERLAAAVRAQEDQKRKATAAAAAPTATAAPVAAPTTAHELEQVRAKQDAWLKGLAAATAPVAAPVTAADPKPAAGSTPAAKHADPTPSASKSATTPSEAATLGAAPAPVSNTALPTTPAAPAAASSNLLLFDDDDEEDAAWLREADREAAGEREARKKRTAEQQAQEAEEQLRRVTRVLPLTSAHLFSID